MERLKAFWAWLKPRWYIPLVFLGLIFAWVLFRKTREKGTPLVQTKVELQAIDAAGQARNKEAEVGAAQARAWVEANYQAEKAALTAEQVKKAEELRDDPAKLAAFLVRASSRQ